MVPTTQASRFPKIAGAEVRSVQIASKGEDIQFLECTTSAERNRTLSAVEAKYNYTKTTTNTTGMYNTHAPTNKRTCAQSHQYTHLDRSLPNQYRQHTLTIVTATDQYTATTLTPVRRDRTNPPPLPPLATYDRPYNLLQLVRPIPPILRAMLSPLVHVIPTANIHHEHRYTHQASAAELYVQNATAKTTTRFTSANGARHRVRTVQRIAILPCCV